MTANNGEEGEEGRIGDPSARPWYSTFHGFPVCSLRFLLFSGWQTPEVSEFGLGARLSGQTVKHQLRQGLNFSCSLHGSPRTSPPVYRFSLEALH